MPDEITLQLSHRDVFLSYFNNYKELILSLQSGNDLLPEIPYLLDTRTKAPVLKLSNKMLGEVMEWYSKGYMATNAKVRFIVAWKAKDAPREQPETAVILADITLYRNRYTNK